MTEAGDVGVRLFGGRDLDDGRPSGLRRLAEGADAAVEVTDHGVLGSGELIAQCGERVAGVCLQFGEATVAGLAPRALEVE